MKKSVSIICVALTTVLCTSCNGQKSQGNSESFDSTPSYEETVEDVTTYETPSFDDQGTQESEVDFSEGVIN